MRAENIKDFLLRLFFEWGAKIYSKKLASGPEAELRRDFLSFVSAEPNDIILDVGCGPGWLAIWAAKHVREVVGCDRSKRIIEIARRNASVACVRNVSFQTADATSLPFPDNFFDIVMATTVIYLLPDANKGFAELVRVAKPDGAIVTLDPDVSISPKKMWAYAKANRMSFKDAAKLVSWSYSARMYYPFPEEKLRGLFEKAGLKNVVLGRRLDGMVWFGKGEKPL